MSHYIRIHTFMQINTCIYIYIDIYIYQIMLVRACVCVISMMLSMFYSTCSPEWAPKVAAKCVRSMAGTSVPNAQAWHFFCHSLLDIFYLLDLPQTVGQVNYREYITNVKRWSHVITVYLQKLVPSRTICSETVSHQVTCAKAPSPLLGQNGFPRVRNRTSAKPLRGRGSPWNGSFLM